MGYSAVLMRRLSQFGLGLLSVLACGCGDDGKVEGPTEEGDGCGSKSVSTSVTTGLLDPIPVDGSACDAVVTAETVESALHVAECSEITYSSNPPSSGPHYPLWAAFTVYDRPVARGFWVHSLEHGAVAFLYDCDDCDSEIDAAKALIDELPEDPRCVGEATRNRMLMTPDPLLDVPWAASAWGFTLRSNCFEPEVFRAFVTEHYAHTFEDFCSPGGTL